MLLFVVRGIRHWNGADPTVTIEHVNGPDTAPHMRVLCRVTAPWPAGYEPFHTIEFQPVISIDESVSTPDPVADPASERLPDCLPDPVGPGGTDRDETAQPESEKPVNTRRNGTRRNRPGRGSSNS